MRTLWAHLRDTPADPSQRRPAVPSAASVVILQALEKDPAGRTQSAGAFAQQLESSLQLTSPAAPDDGGAETGRIADRAEKRTIATSSCRC